MSRTVVATGADATLFHVAARELGDPLQAITLAALSRLRDPWLEGLVPVVVPDAPAPDTGGLPSPGLLP